MVYIEAAGGGCNENYGACSRSNYEKVYDAVEIGQHDYCDPSGGPHCHGMDLKGMETNLAIGRLLLKEGGPMTGARYEHLMHIMVVTAPRSDTHPWLQAAGLGENKRNRSQAVLQALRQAHSLHKALDYYDMTTSATSSATGRSSTICFDGAVPDSAPRGLARKSLE